MSLIFNPFRNPTGLWRRNVHRQPPKEDVEKILSQHMAIPSREPGSESVPVISDASFQSIARCLALSSNPDVARYGKQRPRIYTILYHINRIDVFIDLVKSDFTDFMLPVSVEELPNSLGRDKSRFIQIQNHCLTDAKELEKEEGGRHIFINSSEPFFASLRSLGSGGFGHVDVVWSRLSLNQYARKRFSRGSSARETKAKFEFFIREIGALKRLKHRHLVRIRGTYTDPKSFAFLMDPVADCDLETYLERMVIQRIPDLRTFFGCLANATSYLHAQKVHHMDIKPSNILIKGHKVYLADFGAAHDWSARDRSTTWSSNPRTTAYMPPEFDLDPHAPSNYASDIWSLGVVFLEMLTVLRGAKIKEFRDYLKQKGSQHQHVYKNPTGTTSWLEKLRLQPGPEYENIPQSWVKDMLARDPVHRPYAKQLCTQILEATYFSGFCCSIVEHTLDQASSEHSDALTEVQSVGLSGQYEDDQFQEVYQPPLTQVQTQSIQTWINRTEVVEVKALGTTSTTGNIQFIIEDDDEPTQAPVNKDEDYSRPLSKQLNLFDFCPATAPIDEVPPVQNLVFDIEQDGSDTSASEVTFEIASSIDTPDSESIERHISISEDSTMSEGILTPIPEESTFLDADTIDYVSDSKRNRTEGLDTLDLPPDSVDNKKAIPTLQANYEYSVSGVVDVASKTKDDQQHEGFATNKTVPISGAIVSPEWTLDPWLQFRRQLSPPLVIQLTAARDDINEHIWRPDSTHQVASGDSRQRAAVLNDQVSKSLPKSPKKESRPESPPLEAILLNNNISKPPQDLPVERESKSNPSPPEVTLPLENEISLSPPSSSLRGQSKPEPPPPVVTLSNNDASATIQDTRSRREIAPKSCSKKTIVQDDHISTPMWRPQPERQTGPNPQPKEAVVSNDGSLKTVQNSQSQQRITPAAPSEEANTPKEAVRKSFQRSHVSFAEPLASMIAANDGVSVQPSNHGGPLAQTYEQPRERLSQPLICQVQNDVKNHTQKGSSQSNVPVQDRKLPQPLSIANLAQLDSVTAPCESNQPFRIPRSPGRISPRKYMRQVNVETVSEGTSVMSEGTRRKIQGLSLTVWASKSAPLLENYVSAGKVSAVRVLLEAGCKPNTKGPLMAAIKGKSMKHVKCADALLRKGAQVNVKSSLTGRSALFLAIEQQHYHGYKLLIHTLLKFGADPNLKDKNGDSPLLQILYGGYELLEEHRRDALALIFENSKYPVDVNVTPPGTLNTPLHLAVRRKDPYAAGMLLEKGANILARNGAGQTAFALAVTSWSSRMTDGQKELARILLKAGAEVNERLGPSKSPALHTSIRYGLLDMVHLLMKWGADPFLQSKDGQDAFAVCASALGQERLSQQTAEQISFWLTAPHSVGDPGHHSGPGSTTSSSSTEPELRVLTSSSRYKRLQAEVSRRPKGKLRQLTTEAGR